MKARTRQLRRASLLFFITVSVCTGLYAEGRSEAERQSPQPLFYFIDGKGTEIPVFSKVERVVVVNSGLSALMAALGQDDKIVGRDMFSTFPSSLRPKKVVGKSSAYPNLELIIGCDPDIVLADAMFDDSVAQKLEAAGIRVLIEETSNPSETRSLVRRYGKLFECEQRAAEICGYLDEADTRLQNLITEARNNGEIAPVVFFENRKNYKSASAVSSANQYLELAGGINIAADEPAASPTLSAEFIVEQAPSVIIRRVSGDLGRDTMAGIRDNILHRPGLEVTPAVKSGRVHVIKADLFLTIRYTSALLYHASWFYPETFKTVDPESFHRELIDFMFGEGEWVNTNETFVYP